MARFILITAVLILVPRVVSASIYANASGDGLYRTSSIPSASTVTMCAWFYLNSDLNAIGSIMDLEDDTDGTPQVAFYVNTNGTTLAALYYNGTDQFQDVLAASTGNWYFIAVVKSGTSEVAYARAVTSNSLSVSAALTVAASPAVNRIRFLGSWWSEYVDGRLAAIKVWSGVALTEAELLNESYSYMPRRTANLWYFNPGLKVSDATTDYSGNGNTFSTLGTLTDTDPPPLSWK